MSLRLQRKQRLITNVGVKTRQHHRVLSGNPRHGAVGQIHILRQRVAVEGDVVAVIGGSEGQHGVPVAIGGDGSLVGEGHTACATGVNQDDSAIHFRRKDHPVAVNQDTPAGAVVQASGLRVTAVADIQIASSTAVAGRQAAAVPVLLIEGLADGVAERVIIQHGAIETDHLTVGAVAGGGQGIAGIAPR